MGGKAQSLVKPRSQLASVSPACLYPAALNVCAGKTLDPVRSVMLPKALYVEGSELVQGWGHRAAISQAQTTDWGWS